MKNAVVNVAFAAFVIVNAVAIAALAVSVVVTFAGLLA